MPKPMNKFGRPIYGRVFAEICRISEAFEREGYEETHVKPHLFVQNVETVGGPVAVFADLRGTPEVAIWKDTSALLYADTRKGYPKWLVRRTLKSESDRLTRNGAPNRFSFYATDEPDGLLFEGGDGFCMNCKKDFRGEGEFCSSECENAYSSTTQR